MLEYSQFYQKVTPIVGFNRKFQLKSGVLLRTLRSLQESLSPRSLKNSPIWSHWKIPSLLLLRNVVILLPTIYCHSIFSGNQRRLDGVSPEGNHYRGGTYLKKNERYPIKRCNLSFTKWLTSFHLIYLSNCHQVDTGLQGDIIELQPNTANNLISLLFAMLGLNEI